ncbi:MAG: hypothetical protein AB1632_08830 [Nitrospirota bacterium]
MNHIIKITAFILCLFAITACSAILGPPDSGNDLPLIPPEQTLSSERLIEGQPNISMMPVRGGYYVWKTGKSWHVRISKLEGPPTLYAPRPYFSGVIFVDNAIIQNVTKYNVDPFNDVRSSMKDISFRFELKKDIEGFDFDIKTLGVKYCITLDLRVNGNMTPKSVHLGRSMYMPDTLPVTICSYE